LLIALQRPPQRRPLGARRRAGAAPQPQAAPLPFKPLCPLSPLLAPPPPPPPLCLPPIALTAKQKPRGARDAPAAEPTTPLTPSWTAAKPSGCTSYCRVSSELCHVTLFVPLLGAGKRAGDRAAPASGAAGGQGGLATKGDAKVSVTGHAQARSQCLCIARLLLRAVSSLAHAHVQSLSNPFAALAVDSPTADADD
jgi:hypothetical protein